MRKPRIGIVGVTCQYESGGQRAETLLHDAIKSLEEQNIEVIPADKVVWDLADAVDVCKQFQKEDLDAVAIVVVTWVMDSMKYIFVNKLNVPVVFWAVPYTETFSIGCVQHFGSILKAHNLEYEYVYGLADNPQVVEKVKMVAKTGQIIKSVKNMNLALLGPRQTWRVAGPQDMTNEEWEFSKKFGTTIVHIEMEELVALSEEISDETAKETLKQLAGRTGKVLADEETMIHMAKTYLATKKLIEKYSLNAIAAECYPMYSGLMNLTSSWLADEGVIVDTEGDIGHTLVMYMLNLAANGGACALGEVGSIDTDNNILSIAHEGSTAHSLAESVDKVQISPSGDKGSFVGLPLKPMEAVTVSSIVGSRMQYKLLIEQGSVVSATHQEWVDGGEKLLVKLHLDKDVFKFIEQLMAEGMDHHLVIKEGNYQEILSMLCKFMGIQKITL
ncbi:hypothetical protein [Megamonas sp.]